MPATSTGGASGSAAPNTPPLPIHADDGPVVASVKLCVTIPLLAICPPGSSGTSSHPPNSASRLRSFTVRIWRVVAPSAESVAVRLEPPGAPSAIVLGGDVHSPGRVASGAVLPGGTTCAVMPTGAIVVPSVPRGTMPSCDGAPPSLRDPASPLS